ncbi:hypothetical protein ACTFIT_000984 [Dictyostelium discoideum]
MIFKSLAVSREKYSLTGSRLAAAIGIDPYTSQHDLKLILAKKKTPFFSDYCKKAMEHGKSQEPIAREFYFNELETSIIEKGIFPLPGDKRIGCSPDGVIYTTVPGKDGVLQVKELLKYHPKKVFLFFIVFVINHIIYFRHSRGKRDLCLLDDALKSIEEAISIESNENYKKEYQQDKEKIEKR